MSGITFSETMRGPFDFGVSNPDLGAKSGREKQSELVIQATITIDDIEMFLADPNHSGELTGYIHHPQIAEKIKSGTGSFNLFQPGAEPRQKKMVYELPFEMDGRHYRLIGTKLVQNDEGFDLWSDTTTLYTVLYRDTEAENDIAGAGILRLGFREQIALLNTLRATQTKSPAESAEKITQFLKFFLGELGETYIQQRHGRLPKMVDWYRPTLLLRAASEAVVSTVFGRYADQRLLQAAGLGPACIFDYASKTFRAIPVHSPFTLGAMGSEVYLYSAESKEQRDELWFDYIADTGDGWNSTYTVSYLAAQPELTVAVPKSDTGEFPTHSGEVIVFGGDQVYPSASPVEYERRLIQPFRAAFGHRASDEYPDVYAIPGNHDWYDGLVSFSRIFCSTEPFAGPVRNGKQIEDLGCATPQERSYFVLKLPHGWWLFGTDVQLGHDIDGPQLSFFRTVAQNIPRGDRIILAVAEPYWINLKREEKRVGPEQQTALDALEEALGDRVAVFIAGDVHHYRRYEASDGSKVQKITAGGGGAFLHPTHGPWPEKIPVPGVGQQQGSPRQFQCQKSFPDTGISRRLGWRNFLFPFLNPRFGVATALVYFLFAWMLLPALYRYRDALADEHVKEKNEQARRNQENRIYRRVEPTNPELTTDMFRKQVKIQSIPTTPTEGKLKQLPPSWQPADTQPQNTPSKSEVLTNYAATPWTMGIDLLRQELAVPAPFESLLFMIFTIIIAIGMMYFTDVPGLPRRILYGGGHFLAHYITFFLLFWLGVWLMSTWFNVVDPSFNVVNVLAASVAVVAGGYFLGSFVMGCYFYISLNWCGRHWNEAFSSLHIQDYKHFIRFHIDKGGALNIYPIGVETVPKSWRTVPVVCGPHIEPDQPIEHRLIEEPIRIPK